MNGTERFILLTPGEPERAWCPHCNLTSAIKTPVIFSDYDDPTKVLGRATHTQCQDCGWNPVHDEAVE